jgi:hypothetical protein
MMVTGIRVPESTPAATSRNPDARVPGAAVTLSIVSGVTWPASGAAKTRVAAKPHLMKVIGISN